jgi:hypothetical protein
MDGYKKILKSKNLRCRILSLLRFVPDKTMLRLQYRVKLKRKLNLKSPERFTEKIQWYKLNYKNPVMAQCADKYMAREYVTAKGLGHILTDLYAVFDRPEDIRLDRLPDKFVMKLTNGSGTNLLCKDKRKLVEGDVIRKFQQFVFQVKANLGREWPYMQAKPRIIVEQLLEDETHINNAVNDYKIFCYDGKPTYIICISDRYSDRCNHLVYDTQWNKVHVASEGARLDEDAPKPENLQEMLDVAAKLSEDFPFARIDLYSLENRIYFGEITFYPWSGYMEFEPEEFDYVLGEKFVLRKY